MMCENVRNELIMVGEGIYISHAEYVDFIHYFANGYHSISLINRNDAVKEMTLRITNTNFDESFYKTYLLYSYLNYKGKKGNQETYTEIKPWPR